MERHGAGVTKREVRNRQDTLLTRLHNASFLLPEGNLPDYQLQRIRLCKIVLWQEGHFHVFYHHVTEEFFDSADGRQMYITAPKSTNTPASHGVVAGKHCVAIAGTPEIKF